MVKSTDVKAIYDGDYFLKSVDGFREFSGFDGSFGSLFPRYQRNIRLLDLQPEHRLLEIGCGRGEICIFHALRGGKSKGVDYSADAIKLAHEKAASLNAAVEFVESSFDGLHETPGTYDRILASEFIEHISAEEGERFFQTAFSMLKPGGKLLVFTMPNTLQRRYGYPIQRILAALRGRRLPRQQEDTTSEHYRLYHLNEQNYFSLRKLATQAGFNQIVIGYDSGNDQPQPGLKRIARAIIRKTPLRHILLSNLYLLAVK